MVSPELALADSTGAGPFNGADAGCWKVMTLPPARTVNDRLTEAAATYDALPAWAAVIEQVPGAISVIAPDGVTAHTPLVVEV